MFHPLFFVFSYFDSELVQGAFYERSGNGKVVEALSQWVFMEEGVLRVVSVQHHLEGETEAPSAYTIKQDVVCFTSCMYKPG